MDARKISNTNTVIKYGMILIHEILTENRQKCNFKNIEKRGKFRKVIGTKLEDRYFLDDFAEK